MRSLSFLAGRFVHSRVTLAIPGTVYLGATPLKSGLRATGLCRWGGTRCEHQRAATSKEFEMGMGVLGPLWTGSSDANG